MAAVWASPFSARCSFPERHPQFAGFLHASPGHLSEALREHDLVVVIGAPVFTFHVEGHAAIFDGATTSVPDHRRPRRSSRDAGRHQHRRDDEAGAFGVAGNAAGDKARVAGWPHVAARACCRRSASGRIRAAFALRHHGPEDVLVEEAPSHRPAMQKFMPMRGQDSFYTMASGGLGFSLPAAVGVALGRPSLVWSA